MRNAAARLYDDVQFDSPPFFNIFERRMAGQALDRWHAGGRSLVAGFDNNSMTIVDLGGVATIKSVGASITSVFDLHIGMTLTGRSGLAAEIRAACELIALDSQPLPFEASLPTAGQSVILARGSALPITSETDSGCRLIQIIISWREVLDRAATTRLCGELGTAMRRIAPEVAKPDPFSFKTAIYRGN